MKDKKAVEKLAKKQFSRADWENELWDYTKEISHTVKLDMTAVYDALKSAYLSGFEEGYYSALEVPQDEFGEFLFVWEDSHPISRREIDYEEFFTRETKK